MDGLTFEEIDYSGGPLPNWCWNRSPKQTSRMVLTATVPRRSTGGAVKLHRLIRQGYTDVVDADLSKYLDRAAYCTLVYGAWLKRCGCEQLRLRCRPFLRQRLTWWLRSRPRLTRCHTGLPGKAAPTRVA